MNKGLHGFRHLSVVEQTAQTLEEAIHRGEIAHLLPSEAALSTTLKVSRSTLRRAIAILVQKNLLLNAKGKRTRVTHPHGRQAAVEQASVCFVVCVSAGSHLIKINTMLDEVKAALNVEGIAWDEVYKSELGGRHLKARLQEIVTARKKSCYVLLNSPRAVQQWFAQSGQPTLIFGSRHAQVNLPFIDLDHHAVGWHAGGQFLKNGHKSVLLIVPREQHAVGLKDLEAGLRSYMATTEGTHVQTLWVSPSSFYTTFKRALLDAAAPTAALVCRIELVLSVLGTTQCFQRSIPRDFSMIARDDHPIFNYMTPSITRYQHNLQAMTNKVLRLIHTLQQNIPSNNNATLVVPKFISGQTLLPR